MAEDMTVAVKAIVDKAQIKADVEKALNGVKARIRIEPQTAKLADTIQATLTKGLSSGSTELFKGISDTIMPCPSLVGAAA